MPLGHGYEAWKATPLCQPVPRQRLRPAGGALATPLGILFAALAPWRGQAELTLKPKLLAVVALKGEALLTLRRSAAVPGEVGAGLNLLAAGNRLNATASQLRPPPGRGLPAA